MQDGSGETDCDERRVGGKKQERPGGLRGSRPYKRGASGRCRRRARRRRSCGVTPLALRSSGWRRWRRWACWGAGGSARAVSLAAVASEYERTGTPATPPPPPGGGPGWSQFSQESHHTQPTGPWAPRRVRDYEVAARTPSRQSRSLAVPPPGPPIVWLPMRPRASPCQLRAWVWSAPRWAGPFLLGREHKML